MFLKLKSQTEIVVTNLQAKMSLLILTGPTMGKVTELNNISTETLLIQRPCIQSRSIYVHMEHTLRSSYFKLL